MCLDWGNRFLRFLKDLVQIEPRSDASSVLVWRVKFTPGAGISVQVLNEIDTEEVVSGEDRVGFLPRWYWDELKVNRDSHQVKPRAQEDRRNAPPPAGWHI